MSGLGNARLAIPKVQHPHVAAKQAIGGVGKIAQRRLALSSPATSTAQPSNSVPATQTTPVDPMASTPAPSAPVPTGLFDLPAYTPAAGQPDPRDAVYWANLAKLKFSDEQEYSKGLREQTRADTDYGDALQTAIRNRAVQQRSLGEDAIRGNLGASGWLDRNESEQTTTYTQERAHAARNKEEDDQSRTAIRNAILQGFGIDSGGLLADAGERYGQRKREEAQNNSPEVGGGSSGSAGPTPDSYTGTGSAHAFGKAFANAPKSGGQSAKAIGDLIDQANRKKKK
jgi:hypothetical protein